MDNTANTKTKIIGGIVLILCLPLILYYLGHFVPGFLRYGYLKTAIIWVWLLLIYLYATGVEKQKFLLWPETKRSVLFYIASFIAVTLLVYIAGASQLLFPKLGIKTPTSPFLNQMVSYLHAHPVLLVLTCLTAGIVEELVFRGYLIPRLNILFKNGAVAVIISSLLFGASHFGYGTLVNMWVPLLIGLIFGAYYQKYRNLKVLIACHFFVDFMSMIFQSGKG